MQMKKAKSIVKRVLMTLKIKDPIRSERMETTLLCVSDVLHPFKVEDTATFVPRK